MINGVRAVFLLAGLLLGAAALAQTRADFSSIVAADASGIVRYRLNTNPPQTLIKGQSIPLGARITTAPNSRVVLRFADGQVVALGQRSRLLLREFVYLPTDLGKSRVLLNLTDGNMSIILGAIGQRDPSLVQVQVGVRNLDRAPTRARGNDVGVIVLGISTLVDVIDGKLSLLVASTGQSFGLSAGDRALVRSDGMVQTGSASQVGDAAGRTDDGKTMLARMDEIRGLSSAQVRQISFSLATPPSPDTEEDLQARREDLIPPITGSLPTASTGGGGGGLPCTASCN